MAGSKGKCPKCGGKLRIPAAGQGGAVQTPRSPLDDGRLHPAYRPIGSTPPNPAPAANRAASRAPSPAQYAEARSTIEKAFRQLPPRSEAGASYRSGVAFVAGYLLLLVTAYYLLILATFGATIGYAILNANVFREGSPAEVGTYLAIVVGVMLVSLLLAKTVLAPRAHGEAPSWPIAADAEPLLVDFVQHIAQVAGSPVPEAIALSCDVEVVAKPPKGSRSPLGQQLELTIGLSLVEGLTLEQLAGVIAHELSLFSRDGGMRRAYLIRSISVWFQRIVTERDAWDLALLRSASHGGALANMLVLPLRTGVWLVRWIPWAFMGAAHLLAGPLMRSMQLNADRCQAQLVGSEAFESCFQQRILLQYAMRGTQSDLEVFRQASHLPDNLPRFVMATVAQQPPEVRQTMLELIDRLDTGPLDPRPSDQQRIAAARALRAPGTLHCDLPATALFADFDQTARRITNQHYRAIFGDSFHTSALRPVEDLIDCQALEERAAEARKRYLLGVFGLLRPLRLPSPHVDPPSAVQLVRTQLKHQRDQMAELASAYAADYALYAEADHRHVETSQAIAVFKAGLTPTAERFSTSIVSMHQARELRSSSGETLRKLATRMEAFEAAAGRRLHAALTLLHASQVAAKVEDVAERRKECAATLVAMSAIAGHLEDVYQLRTDHAKLVALAEHARQTSASREAAQELQRRAAKVFRELQSLHEFLEHIDFPFEDEARTSVAEYLLPKLPPATNLQAIIEKTQEMLDKLVLLYGRCIDRLCATAEEVEAALIEPAREQAPTQ